MNRKYAMTRVAPGDYVFPSNDGRTLWRVFRYVDGPSMGLDDWPRDRQLWGLRRWHEPVSPDSVGTVNLDASDRWVLVADMFDTRRDAIERALR